MALCTSHHSFHSHRWLSLLFSQSFSSSNSARACFQSPMVETSVSGTERSIVSSTFTCRPPANKWCAIQALFFDNSSYNVSPLMSVPLHSLSEQDSSYAEEDPSVSLVPHVSLAALGDYVGFGVGDAAGVRVPLLRLPLSLFSHISVCNIMTRSSVSSSPPSAGPRSHLCKTRLLS